MLRSWWRGRPQRKAVSRRPTFRPGLERLENRTLMSATLIKDINTTPVNPQPADLTNVKGTLFFTTLSGTANDLWKSDGTPGGTTLVRSFVSGGGQRELRSLTAGNTLYAAAAAGPGKVGLWKTDGTAAGTVLITSFPLPPNPFPGPFPPSFVMKDVNGTLYFTRSGPNQGTELWKTDGTPGGTVLVKAGKVGGTPFFAFDLTNVNGVLYFISPGGPGLLDMQLWKSDGTTAGTVPLKTFHGNEYLPGISWIKAVDGTLYFAADDGTHGNELWKWA
jgi:ELWxxDGT repeat protein